MKVTINDKEVGYLIDILAESYCDDADRRNRVNADVAAILDFLLCTRRNDGEDGKEI